MKQSNGTTRLIINADDFGWTRGICDGILLAHCRGLVTSTSLMVNQRASDYALLLAARHPRLAVGVHLNLSDGAPLLPPDRVPSLVDAAGRFYGFARLHRRLLRWQASSREMEAEFRTQIQWMKQRGLTPVHADSHHHVHVYPAVVLPFKRALAKEGIRRARGYRLRHWREKGVSALSYGGPAPRRWLIGAYVEVMQRLIFRRLHTANSSVVVLPAFRRQLPRLKDGWRDAFAKLAPGTYDLGCHPGISEAGFSETDPLREVRECELEALTSRDLRRDVRRHGIELISYAQL